MKNHQPEPRFHYGWIIVIIGCLILFACMGLARFAFGMLLPSMGVDLGLGYDQMGFIGTANFAGYLVSVALAPKAIGRFRPRAVIFVGLLLISVCMFGISRSEAYGAVLCFYALIGVGTGFANIPLMVVVSHWFRKERRGLAAGLTAIGIGTAIMASGVLIPVYNRGIEEGWRSVWLLLALATLCIAGAAGTLLRNDPADLGLEPVGRRTPIPPEQLARKDVGGARILIRLGVLYFIFGATYMVYGTFIVTTMVEDYGFSEARAGAFWTWIGFFSLFSGVIFGILSDRIGRKGGIAAVFTIQTLAYLLAGIHPGSGALMISVALYGLAVFAIPTIMAAAVADYMGLARAAPSFSLITLFFAVGQIAGPGAAGVLAKWSGSFSSSYLTAAALTGAAVLLATRLPEPDRGPGGIHT